MGEIRDLEPVAKALNEESNALRDILATLNNKLGSLNIGLQVWLSDHFFEQCFARDVWPSGALDVLDKSPGDDYFFAWDLGYIKWGDQWSVAVRPVWVRTVHNPDYDLADEVVPAASARTIMSAPRSVRIAAVQRLPDLIDCIKASAEKGIEAIREARKLAENL